MNDRMINMRYARINDNKQFYLHQLSFGVAGLAKGLFYSIAADKASADSLTASPDTVEINGFLIMLVGRRGSHIYIQTAIQLHTLQPQHDAPLCPSLQIWQNMFWIQHWHMTNMVINFALGEATSQY